MFFPHLFGGESIPVHDSPSRLPLDGVEPDALTYMLAPFVKCSPPSACFKLQIDRFVFYCAQKGYQALLC